VPREKTATGPWDAPRPNSRSIRNGPIRLPGPVTELSKDRVGPAPPPSGRLLFCPFALLIGILHCKCLSAAYKRMLSSRKSTNLAALNYSVSAELQQSRSLAPLRDKRKFLPVQDEFGAIGQSRDTRAVFSGEFKAPVRHCPAAPSPESARFTHSAPQKKLPYFEISLDREQASVYYGYITDRL
jgi:hypothetical protein